MEGMKEKEVFGLALGLQGSPWYVAEIGFDLEAQTLEITLEFAPLSRFEHPETGALCPVYDATPRTWRHLNFFQFRCEVKAHVPRVDGGAQGGGVKQVRVPWARERSGFTLLMESWMVLLGKTGMTVLSETGGEGSPSRVLYVTEGKDAAAVGRAGKFLEERGAKLEKIKHVCLDMSAAFVRGVRETFTQAELVFDCFHVVQLAQQGLDQVRRRERLEFPEELKNKRWVVLKGVEKLTPEELAQREALCRGKLQTGKACYQVDALREISAENDHEADEEMLRWWCGWVRRSRIPEMVKVAKSIREHWDGIVAYMKTRITNGAAEALNGIIQTIKRKSRGFKRFEYFRTMIYLVASRLVFKLPSPVPVTHTKS